MPPVVPNHRPVHFRPVPREPTIECVGRSTCVKPWNQQDERYCPKLHLDDLNGVVVSNADC
jgi:hypothetical protein